MSAQSNTPQARRKWVVPSRGGDGATTFELFFDLVCVFGITQVTDFMTHEHGPLGPAPRRDPARSAVVDVVGFDLARQPGAW